ncbi:hypothetical protein J3Q64DRAFT_1752371 [Phycomyces blakesleeanus]|uniref:Uncharacterized protein n=1 Tax=Phycomyces blakesleeanus TaxID=4837 RepID=A0ABR3AV34_PHYBL
MKAKKTLLLSLVTMVTNYFTVSTSIIIIIKKKIKTKMKIDEGKGDGLSVLPLNIIDPRHFSLQGSTDVSTCIHIFGYFISPS